MRGKHTTKQWPRPAINERSISISDPGVILAYSARLLAEIEGLLTLRLLPLDLSMSMTATCPQRTFDYIVFPFLILVES